MKHCYSSTTGDLSTGDKWFAADGKELRGSIRSGDKRGEAVVQVKADHAERSVAAQAFYNGKKESEKPTLRTLLSENKLLDQYISMDALHLDPITLAPIAQAGGWFLVAFERKSISTQGRTATRGSVFTR